VQMRSKTASPVAYWLLIICLSANVLYIFQLVGTVRNDALSNWWLHRKVAYQSHSSWESWVDNRSSDHRAVMSTLGIMSDHTGCQAICYSYVDADCAVQMCRRQHAAVWFACFFLSADATHARWPWPARNSDASEVCSALVGDSLENFNYWVSTLHHWLLALLYTLHILLNCNTLHCVAKWLAYYLALTLLFVQIYLGLFWDTVYVYTACICS